MKTFHITAPITGTVEIYVQAETEEAAIEIASDTLTSDNIVDWTEDLSQADVTDETPDEA